MAWANDYSISHSDGMRCGNMKCDKCEEEIEGFYLIRDRTNFKHRGNETDERYIYHEKCSPTGTSRHWDNYRESCAEEEKKEAKREIKRLELIKDIRKWGFDEEDLFDD
jgi:hypothetical protein